MKPCAWRAKPAGTNNNSNNTALQCAILVSDNLAVNVHRCKLLSLHRFSLLLIYFFTEGKNNS